MNEKIKEYKIDNIVMGILSAVVGVILVIFPGTTLRMIGYLVSAALFLMGIVSIIIYMRRKTEDNFMKNDFCTSRRSLHGLFPCSGCNR